MKNPPKHVESRGNEGINRFTFWVSDSLLEYWNELPDITPEQLQTSRLFKYIFTGDLNSKVKSFVSFPGKEMHLLKCQIVRILHSSSIVPKGYQKLSENYKDQLEGKIVEYDEEYKPASFDEMKDPELANWSHEYAYIYPSGKVIDTKAENQIERMKGIGEDEGYKVKEGEGDNVNEIDLKYWKIKVVGDQIMHNRPNGDPLTHAVVIVKNNRWPGSLTVWKEEKFAQSFHADRFPKFGRQNFHLVRTAAKNSEPNESFIIFGEANFFQAATISERFPANFLNAVGNVNLSQAAAAQKCVKANSLHAVGNFNLSQAAAAGKSAVADIIFVVRNFNFLQAAHASKNPAADTLFDARKINFSQTATAEKRAKLNTAVFAVRKANFRQAAAIFERIHTNFFNAVGNVNFFQAATAFKGIGVYFPHAVGNINLGQAAATFKGVVEYHANAVRQNNFRQLRAIFKFVVVNYSRAFGQNDGADRVFLVAVVNFFEFAHF